MSKRFMQNAIEKLCLFLASFALFSAAARGAVVGPTGYTNDFSLQPSEQDWATWSRPGAPADVYDMDLDVNATIASSGVTNQTAPRANNPVASVATATWSSIGFYLQTRPLTNRYTALMAKFVNNTGSNATQIAVSYLLTIAGSVAAEDKGTRVYYSLSGATNSWVNLPALNNTASNGTYNLNTNLSLNWPNGTPLYFLWADDNAIPANDVANQIDNFSLLLTAAVPPPVTGTLDGPTNTAVFSSDTSVSATTTVTWGTSPYVVRYWTNSGAGNTSFQLAASSTTSPYSLTLNGLAPGTYHIYATVTDNNGAGATATTATNTFTVVSPLTLTLNDPVNGAIFYNDVSVIGRSAVSGGTAPYSVQFLLDGAAHGSPSISVPYNHDFGPLPIGNHTISATVTDASGWVSNSVVRTIRVDGPLSVSLMPTNGESLLFGQPVLLAAAPIGGTNPYVVTFFTNGQAIGSRSSSPYSTNLGVLPVGSYTSYVHATDSSTPLAQQNTSSTNIFAVVPNPLVVAVTSPTNGQTIIGSQVFAPTATVSVGAPVTITSVEFFFDGISAGVDTNAPFSGSVTNPAEGSHAVYALAIDSLGRTSYSATNQATFVGDPLANDNFINRFNLDTPARVIGANAGATTEGGEPTFFFIPPRNFAQWGATLWWKWTAPFSGAVTIDTVGSDFNTFLSAYTGDAVNTLSVVAQNDNALGLANVSLITFDAQQGIEYQIQVGGIRGGGPGGGNPATGNIHLNLTMPPFAAITNPVAGSGFLVGTNFAVDVIAASSAAAITNVSLYRGSTLLGSAASAPYSFVVSNAPPGTNSFYAVALDGIGQSGTSAVVRVLVANVGITITSPEDDTIFASTNPIPVSVFAALPSGSITNVAFFVDGQPFGQSGTAPFGAAWSNVMSGSHRLTARGVDDAGNIYAATPVNIGVGQLLVHSNAVWKYLADGSDQSNAWLAVSYDDSGWLSGPAELGYGDNDEATLVPSGPAGNFYITTYFRHSFVVTNVASFSSMLLLLAYDDGAAVYLNGQEIYRTANLPASAAYNTVTTGAAIEETVDTATLSPTNLVEGNNVLAVEMHQQATNSSDISFFLQLVGVPQVIHNQYPLVSLDSPSNGTTYFAPANITLHANASDPDGAVSKVEFFSDGLKIGESTNAPFSAVWAGPPVGPHSLYAIATDNQDGRQSSAAVNIMIYNAAGTPFVGITSPTNNTIVEGPTNMLVTAFASAIDAVTNVQFFANGSSIGNDTTSPFGVFWNAPFGINQLQAIVSGADGRRGTSAVANVTITIPPTNTVAPRVARQFPTAFTTVSNASFTNVTIVFSERVQNVDAGDLLVNGVPATGVIGSGSNYTFSFPRPPYGEVEIAFASGHGITDFGYPTNLPFNELDGTGFWEYDYIDIVAPSVLAHVPATGATVTNLTTVSVTFSEAVSGVDASDLLVNGTPAFAVSGDGGSNYIFNVSQPASGTVNITWATNHDIADLGVSGPPIPFNETGAGATWAFTLDSRTTFVQSNSTWKYIKGLAEASAPTNAWRQPGFDDSAWTSSPAPFVFGEPTFTNALNPGTGLNDMTNNAYSSIYLRQPFVVAKVSAITNLFLRHQSDDGFIAWINGVEVLRYNMPTGEIPFNGSAVTAAPESGNAGAAYITATLGTNAVSALTSGTNILAVHAFNVVTNPASSDFVFNAQLYTFVADTAFAAPRIVSVSPVQGDVFSLSNLTVTFSEGVQNVDAADLLVNGVPAGTVTSITNTIYTFGFAQPAYGNVSFTWATNHGIVDFDGPPQKPFDGNLSSSRFTYTLVNPSAPIVISQMPAGGTTITGLTSIAVAFSEPVTGVDAADLLVNGVPANSISGSGSNFTFFLPQPAYGVVTIRWATNNGIRDLENPANDFERTRPNNQWNYSLVNPVPTVTMTSPTNNAYMLIGVNVPLRATATDNDGTIASVEFVEEFEGNHFGPVTNAPYSATWSNVPGGTYRFRAIATDNSGLMATSAPVLINVVAEIPPLLVRGPYLQSGSSTGAVVRWRTDRGTDTLVRYGPNVNSLTNFVVGAVSNTEHIVQVGGLLPDTKYFYSIGSSNRTLAGGVNQFGDGTNYWFITSPVAGTIKPTRFWALGDSGTANANARAVRDAYYSFAATNRPADFWLMLGDNAYNAGLDSEYQSAVFDMYPDTLRNLFLWPVLGNHESDQSYTATAFPYLNIFSTPQNGEAGGVPSGNPKYYSFDYANIHFIGLDSMTSERTTNSAMAHWLVADLENNTQDWTIVYFHHPPYTKGSHNSDAETDLIEVRQNLLPILESHDVDLVLSGHSHVHERSYLLHGHYGLSTTLVPSMKVDAGDGREEGTGAYRKNADGQGVVYIVAGSSGQTGGGTLNHPAHFVSLNELGSMVVDINSNRLDAMFLTGSGTISDRFTLLKRGPAPSSPLNVLAQFLATNQIRLSWIDVATNELGYIIERSLDGLSFVRVATNGPNTTLFVDGGLLANTTYYYRVRSFNGVNESVASSVASGATAIARPVIAASVNASTRARALVLSGTPGILYTIEKTTNLANSSFWQVWQSVTLSNASQLIDASAGTNAPVIYYRARQ